MIDEKKLDAIAEIALLKNDPAKVQQLADMIDAAFIGNKPDRDFIIANAQAYSGLNSKATLTVVGRLTSKEMAQKAVEIVALLRHAKKAKAGVSLPSVLGSVIRTTQPNREDAAWERALSEFEPISLDDYDLSKEDSLEKAITELLKRNDAIAARAKELEAAECEANIDKEAEDAVKDEQDEEREAILANSIGNVVKQILLRLGNIYSDMFVNPPMGVLTPEGIYGVVGIETGNYSVRKTALSATLLSAGIFKFITQAVGDELKMPPQSEYDTLPVEADGSIRNGLFNPDGSCAYTYMPKLQAHMATGIYRESGGLSRTRKFETFSEKMETALTKDIRRIYKKAFAGRQNLLECMDEMNNLAASLLRLYTTTFVAEEVDSGKVIRLRMSCPGVDSKALLGVGTSLLAAKNLGIDSAAAKLLNNSHDNGIVKVTLAVSKEDFAGETLFAYEAMQRTCEAGGSIGMDNIVIGRRVNGDTMTLDFKAMGSTILSIQGAGRSGKGVLTLTILATIIGSGYPFIYLDNKPDMAAMMWQLEQEYGCRILSLDITGKDFKEVKRAGGEIFKAAPIRCGKAYNLPSGLPSDIDWHAFAYAKAMALYGLAMDFKGSGKCSLLDKQDRMYAIFDEASATSLTLTANQKSLTSFKNDSKDKEKVAVAEKIVTFLQNTKNSIGTISTKYPNAGLKIIVLSQKSTGSSWGGGGEQRGGILIPLLYGAKMRLLGTENTTSDDYAMGQAKAQGVTLVGKKTPGHFVYLPDQTGMAGVELDVFKSYLVLNENDYDPNGQHGEFIGQLTGTIQNQTSLQAALKKVSPDGQTPNPLVGFPGLLKYVGEKSGADIAGAMSQGYLVMEEVAAYVGIAGDGGRYETLEDWFYDSDPDTFWSVTELKTLADACEKVPGVKGGKSGAVIFDDDDDYEDLSVNESVSDAVSESPVTYEPVGSIEQEPEGLPNTAFDDNVSDSGATHERSFASDLGLESEPPIIKPTPVQSPFAQQPFTQPQQPQFQQPQQPQYQKPPRIFFNGQELPYFMDEHGNLHCDGGGRYRDIVPNSPPGHFNGMKYTSQPICESAPPAFTQNENGEMVLTDPSMMHYALPLTEPPVRFRRAVPAISHRMKHKQLEQAVSERWRRLLAAGARLVGNVGLVVQVSVGDNYFATNGKSVPLTADIVGDGSVPVSHLADFRVLFNTYKNLKQLDVDFSTRLAFNIAYNTPAIPFTRSKVLQRIRFQGSNGQWTEYTRAHAAQQLQIPPDNLNSRFNTWSAFAAQVNKGKTSALCAPGHRLRTAEFTKRMAAGVFAQNSSWSMKRRAFGFIGMILGGAGTVVTGGIQAGRAALR